MSDVFEVDGEITFESYDGDPIVYETTVSDKYSNEYAWWENVILPVVSCDVNIIISCSVVRPSRAKKTSTKHI